MRQLMLFFSQMLSQMKFQEIVPPNELKVAHFVSRVSIKGSYVDPSGQNLDTTASYRRGLYVDDNPPCLIALGTVYEGLATMHHVPLGNDMVNMGV